MDPSCYNTAMPSDRDEMSKRLFDPANDGFTPTLRKAMQLANSEAQRFNHYYLSTEHILLGLVAEGTEIGRAHV